MKYTSASANKMIRFLEDRKNYLLQQESNDSRYVLAEDEKAERPPYVFNDYNAQIDETRLECVQYDDRSAGGHQYR